MGNTLKVAGVLNAGLGGWNHWGWMLLGVSGLDWRLSGFVGVQTVASARALHLPTNSV